MNPVAYTKESLKHTKILYEIEIQIQISVTQPGEAPGLLRSGDAHGKKDWWEIYLGNYEGARPWLMTWPFGEHGGARVRPSVISVRPGLLRSGDAYGKKD